MAVFFVVLLIVVAIAVAALITYMLGMWSSLARQEKGTRAARASRRRDRDAGRPDTDESVSCPGEPREGEQLPEEQPAGSPHTGSDPEQRKRRPGLDTGPAEKKDRPRPATGNPRQES